MVAGTFTGMAVPTGEGAEKNVEALRDRQSPFPPEHPKGKELTEAALFKKDVPPKLNMLQEPPHKTRCKGSKNR